MIEKLKWDSDFFGYPVGRIQLETAHYSHISDITKDTAGFRLVYLVCPKRIRTTIKGLKLVDIKTRFSKQINNEQSDSFGRIHEYSGGADDQLERLALQSGVFSRFKADANFVNNEFERLYLKWIKESINKTIADKVVVYKKDSNKCIGFITLKFNEDFSEIGLIAVDEGSRGKGIGKTLLSYAAYITQEMGLQKIEVVTQHENHPAVGLYKKCGYGIISKKYIYHLWN